jgi:MFS family permease
MAAMRPVWMLSATQALCMSGSFLFVLLGGIIGSHLAPAPALATLPVSVLIAGLAASVIPAGTLIHRFGRRAVFVGSSLQAAAGCVLAGFAIAKSSFWMFCAAAFLSAPTTQSSCSTASPRPSTWIRRGRAARSRSS